MVEIAIGCPLISTVPPGTRTIRPSWSTMTEAGWSMRVTVPVTTVCAAAAPTSAPPSRLLDAARERLASGAGPMAKRPGARGRGDKTKALAAAWAHEQARLAMHEILEHEARRGALRDDLSRPLLAWLLIAARDALAHESPDALDERVQALGRFLRLTPGRGGS